MDREGDARVDVLRSAPRNLLNVEGALDPALRRAAFEHAASPGTASQLPEPLASFVQVTVAAYKVVDGDLVAFRDAGYSEDAVLEAVLATAAGAGLSRLETGLRALEVDR